MKTYIIYKETVYEGEVGILGVFTSEQFANDMRNLLEKSDSCANPKHPSIYYSVHSLDLDDSSLADLHVNALQCLQKKNMMFMIKKTKQKEPDEKASEEKEAEEAGNDSGTGT